MKKIILFASEIAIITRQNQYENISKIIMKLWEKNYPDDFKHINKLMEDKNLDLNIVHNVEKNIADLSRKYNLDLKKEISQCLNSSNVSNLKKNQEKIMQNVKIADKKDMELIRKSIISKTNTNFGTKYEGNSIDFYTKNTGNRVNIVTNFFKKELFESNNIKWMIGGKIDGITDNDILVEVKNRTRKLFYNLRDYEKTQVMTYLNILDLPKAHLVESLKNNKNEINIIELEYSEKYWQNQVFNKIVQFTKFFDSFLAEDSYKIALLNDSSIIDQKYDSFISQLN